ncbi:glycine zipper 2TM domain-containing protein [Halotalea alkalilenta]|uniref:Glycine zipper 2TM domain-containing protein n=1 Tax=Halotalea alkalilenta TaxID=376489 RepID=A0A172YBK7_9GAMM|nr:glycine zipper 2TM domain-containing protein [Halotalea alkalilenta]ANF56598.1 hypothetical protein A5892_03195 [Halotalea alkalilenta]
MNKSIAIGATIGVLGIVGGVAVASYVGGSNEPAYAEVLSVTPVTRTVETPRQVCEQVSVNHYKPPADSNNIIGTAAGAVIGGLVGNQFGGGSGRKILTAAGAVGGGYAGNQIQGNMNRGSTYTTTENRCHTVTESHEEQVGFDVVYSYDGQNRTVRTEQDPGKRLPVYNGQVVLPGQNGGIPQG